MMRLYFAHGGGGGFDEMLLFGGAVVIGFGVITLRDKKLPQQRRRRGWFLLPIGVALAMSPIALAKMRGPRIAAVRITSSATLSIVEPQPGAVVRTSTMPVVIRLEGATLSTKESINVRPGLGHLHAAIDGKQVSASLGLRDRVDVNRLAAGRHLLQIEYVATDHASFSPPVLAVVSFETAGVR